MKILLICKRNYTNKDLIKDKFGRNYWLPKELSGNNTHSLVIAVDYYGDNKEELVEGSVSFFSLPLKTLRLFKYLKEFSNMINEFKPDIVIGSGDSHLGYLASRIAKKQKASFVFDIYDYYPSFGSNRLPMMKFMYYQAMKKAALVLCVSQNLKKHIAHYNKNVLIIENGVDTSLFKIKDKNTCKEVLNIEKDEIVVGYFGSMETMRGVGVLLDTCEMLVAGGMKLRLLLAGKNSSHLKFDKPWIDYRGTVSQAQIVSLINASDVVTMPYQPVHQFIEYCNSCKTAEYMACEVPIVSTKNNDLMTNYPAFAEKIPHALCEPGDATKLKNAIIYQLENQKIFPLPAHMNWKSLANRLKQSLTLALKNK